MSDFLLNDFQKSAAINDLREFNVVDIISNFEHAGFCKYYFFFKQHGILFLTKMASVELRDLNKDEFLSSFIKSSRSLLSNEIETIDEWAYEEAPRNKTEALYSSNVIMNYVSSQYWNIYFLSKCKAPNQKKHFSELVKYSANLLYDDKKKSTSVYSELSELWGIGQETLDSFLSNDSNEKETLES